MVVGAVATCLVLAAWLGTRVFDELSHLHSAPHDNVQWAASQLETEALRMHSAAVDLAADRTGGVDEFRKRFDIFYSRVDLVRSGQMFESLRGDPEVDGLLETLEGFLVDAVPVVDGPDDELIAWLPAFLAQSEDVQAATRALALATIARFARNSDRDREAFADLLVTASAFGIGVIFVLLLAAIVLTRQIRLAHARADELRRSEERLSAMVNSALDAVIVMNSEGRIIDFNPPAEKIFGYPRADAIGQPLAELIIPPAYREAHLAGLKRHLETGETAVVGHGRFELSALNSRGEEFPVELAVGRSVGEDGPIFVAYLRDITRRKEAETTLRDARDRAEAADRAKSEFLAVMSHEMRTPLNGVLGAVDLLRSTRLDDKQAQYVGLAEKSGEILLQHITDVLDLTKIEAGRLEIETEPFDPAALVRELAEVTREEALKRDNQIDVEVGSGIPDRALGDPHRIRQILLNLLANAIKFTSEGRIVVGLRGHDAAADGTMLEFSVSDTGIGISEEDCERLFDEFVVLNPSYTRDVGGAGLGLAICRRIATALGGEIGVESSLGEGSRFWVRIPMPASREVGPSQSEFLSGRTAPGGRRVLLAEDNATNRTIAAEMLINAGYSVEIAGDGAEAVRMAERAPYDFILMDISMPRMDGIEATKRIRRGAGASRDAAIIGITAHAMPSEIERFTGAGMQGCLTKPLRLHDLLEVFEIAEPSAAGRPGLGHLGADSGGGALQSSFRECPLLDHSELERLQRELAPDSFERLLKGFLVELDDLALEIARALESGDTAKIQRQAHGLHGSAASIGAARLAALMAATEVACKAGQLDKAIGHLAHLKDVEVATAIEIDGQLMLAASPTSTKQDR